MQKKPPNCCCTCTKSFSFWQVIIIFPCVFFSRLWRTFLRNTLYFLKIRLKYKRVEVKLSATGIIERTEFCMMPLNNYPQESGVRLFRKQPEYPSCLVFIMDFCSLKKTCALISIFCFDYQHEKLLH